MENWQNVEKATESAKNSAGSATKEQDKMLNSIQGKMNAVESSMQKLASATVDESLVKWFLDLKKAVLDFGTSIGGLVPVFTLMISLLSIKLAPAIGNVIKKFSEFTSSAGSISTTVGGTIAIVGTLASVFMAVTSAINANIEAQRQQALQSIESSKKIEEQKKTLDDLISEYNILASSEDFSKNEQSRERVKDIQSQITSLVGEQASNLDLVNGKLSEQQNNLKNISAEQAKINSQDLEAAKIASDTLISKTFETWQDTITGGTETLFTGNLFDNIENQTKGINDLIKSFESIQVSAKGAGEQIWFADPKNLSEAKQLESELISLRNGLQDIGATNDDLYSNTVSNLEKLQSVIGTAEEAYSRYYENEALIDVLEQSKTMSVNTQEDLDAFVYKLVLAENASVEYADALKRVAESYFGFSEGTNGARDATKNYISNTSNAIQATSDLNSQIDAGQKSYKTLSDAIDEYNKSGSLSADTIQSLLELGSEELKLFFDAKNGTINLKDAVNQLTEARVKNLETLLEEERISQVADKTNEITQLQEIINAEETTEEQRQNAIESIQTLSDEIVAINEQYGLQIDLLGLVDEKTSEELSLLEQKQEAYSEQSSALDEAQSAYETLSEAIAEYNENGILSYDTLQSILSLSPEYLQSLFDETGALNTAEAAALMEKAALDAKVEALKQAKIDELAAAAAAEIMALAASTAGNSASSAVSGVNGLGGSAQSTGNKAVTAASQLDRFNLSLRNSLSLLNNGKSFDISGSQYNSIISKYQNLAKSISNISVGLVSGGSKRGGGGSSGSGVVKTNADEVEKAYDTLLSTTMKMLKKEQQDRIDALEKELDLEEDLYKAQKKRIEDEIDGYKDIIDKKKESLKLEKEEKDYQDDISEKNKEISDIQNRLIELEFDNSASATAEKLKLQEELEDKNKELANAQYDRQVDLTEDALDKEYDEYKTAKDKEIDALEENFNKTKEDYENRIDILKQYLEEENTIRTEAIALIESKSEDFYNRLFAWNTKYGSETNATLQGIIDKAHEAIYAINEATRSGGGGSSKSLSSIFDTVANAAKVVTSSVGAKAKVSSGVVSTNLTSGSNKGTIGNAIANLTKKHDGIDSGFVGDGLKGNELFIKALKGEAFITPLQQNKYMNEHLPKMLQDAKSSVKSGDTNFNFNKLIEMNVSGSVDSNSVKTIETAVNNAFVKLNNTLSQNGIIRKANAFA